MLDVYVVGARQVRDMCGWRYAKKLGRLESGVHCDSLAKGRYLVVGVWCCKDILSEPTIFYSGCKRDAVDFCDRNLGGLSGCYLSPTGTAYEYELWALVDDYELWAEWETLSGQNAIDVDLCGNYACGVCGHVGERGCEFFISELEWKAKNYSDGESCEECGCRIVYPHYDRYGMKHYYCIKHMPDSHHSSCVDGQANISIGGGRVLECDGDSESLLFGLSLLRAAGVI